MKPAAAPLRRWRYRLLSGGAAIAVVALMAAGAWCGYNALLSQPLEHVVFAGEVDRLPHAELDALAQGLQAFGQDGASLAAVREAARRVPWVRDATVRRSFPSGVEITFEAHEALARWNDASLVSKRGEVFVAGDAGELPRLRGPEGTAVAMVQEYPTLARLLAPLGSPIAELRLSRRGAWQALLASGLVLELGRGDVAARAERFVAAWPQLAQQDPPPKYADLRYSNGFALRAGRTP